MPAQSTPSDAQVQQVYEQVLAQYGGRAGVNGIDIGYAHADAAAPEQAAREKVVRIHVEQNPAADQTLPSEIDGVKIMVIEAKYGPEQ